MEAAGLAFGAISLAGLFDNVINCFERFHAGKNFSETFQRALLQLEVLELRLLRWRDAVTKLDPAVRDAHGSLVERHLTDIHDLFQKEQKLAKHYVLENAELSAKDEFRSQAVVKNIRRLSYKHRRGTLLLRDKMRWAIRGKREFEELIGNISLQVANLEQIIPTGELERLLEKMRIEDAEEIGHECEVNKKDIEFLQETATVVDPKFAKMVDVHAGHRYEGNIVKDQALLHQGDFVSPEYRGKLNASGNSYTKNKASGNSRVTQGTAYGYHPFQPLSSSK